MRGGGAQDAERRDQVDAEHGQVLLVGGFLDDVVPGVAGVVDDDVEAAKVFHGGADETIGKAGLGHAAIDRDRLAAGCLDFGDDRVTRRGVEIVDHDTSALAGKLERDGAADAASRTRDECDFSLEFRHLVSLLRAR